MTHIRSFFTEVISALRTLLADDGARSTMIVGILIYSVLYPQPYVGEVLRDVPIAVIDQDHSTTSRSFVRAMDVSDSVEVTLFAPDLNAARDAFFRREVYGIIIIPERFEADILDSKPAPIAAYSDGSYLLIYSNVVRTAAAVARSMGVQVNYSRLTALGVDASVAETLVAPVTVNTVSVYNPQGGYASYVVPAAFVLILQQTLTMGIGLLHAGRAMPRGRKLAATVTAYLGLYVIWVAFTQMLLPFLYGIPRAGDVAAMYLIAVPFLCACTAMGFALSQLIPWREGVVFFLVVLGMPLFFLSGISWPAELIPEPLRFISLLVPSSSAISAFVAVDQMGATAKDVASAIETQLVLTVTYSVVALLASKGKRQKSPKNT